MNTAIVQPALDVKAVSHAYGARKALDDVSLSVAPGEFCALLGLNGAGKSTLFALITRLFSYRAGSIDIFGFDLRRNPGEALRRIGVVFQSRTLDPDLSVIQNMAYHAALHGISGRDGRILAMEALDRVALAERAKEKVRALSGGQARRVEIARALIHKPRLLLLDEPTVGLDVGARRDIAAQLRALIAADGVGVLWATHLMDEVLPGDKAVVLHRGKVMAAGGAGDIMNRAGASDMTQAFTSLTDAGDAEDAA